MGFVWLAHTNIGLSYVTDISLEFTHFDALDLGVVLSVSNGNFLPVGLHFLIGTTLELVILVDWPETVRKYQPSNGQQVKQLKPMLQWNTVFPQVVMAQRGVRWYLDESVIE